MKLTRNMKWALTGVGLVLVVVLGLVLSAVGGSKKTAGILDNTRCEFCGKPLPKSGLCPSCIAQMGLESYREKRESKHWYNNSLIATIIITMLCILIMTHAGLTLRKFMRGKKAEIYCHTRCGKCGRKIRYRDSQAEHLGRCPFCHNPLRFPKPPVATKLSLWNKVRGVSWRKIRQIVWD